MGPPIRWTRVLTALAQGDLPGTQVMGLLAPLQQYRVASSWSQSFPPAANTATRSRETRQELLSGNAIDQFRDSGLSLSVMHCITKKGVALGGRASLEGLDDVVCLILTDMMEHAGRHGKA